MATLHVLSHSPFADTRLSSCLSLMGLDDGVLLCGDATYAFMKPDSCLQTREAQVFALDEDLKARNLQAPEGVICVDYAGFVELSIRFDRVNTWL